MRDYWFRYGKYKKTAGCLNILIMPFYFAGIAFFLLPLYIGLGILFYPIYIPYRLYRLSHPTKIYKLCEQLEVMIKEKGLPLILNVEQYDNWFTDEFKYKCHFFEIIDVTDTKLPRIKYYKVFKKNEFKDVLFWKNIDTRIARDLGLFAESTKGKLPIRIISPEEYDNKFAKIHVDNMYRIYRVIRKKSLYHDWIIRYDLYENQ